MGRNFGICAKVFDQLIFFFGGYKGGKIYWLAIHSNQANLIVDQLIISSISDILYPWLGEPETDCV
jgi:hypothetical protein